MNKPLNEQNQNKQAQPQHQQQNHAGKEQLGQGGQRQGQQNVQPNKQGNPDKSAPSHKAGRQDW